jgi:hypothetical protein
MQHDHDVPARNVPTGQQPAETHPAFPGQVPPVQTLAIMGRASRTASTRCRSNQRRLDLSRHDERGSALLLAIAMVGERHLSCIERGAERAGDAVIRTVVASVRDLSRVPAHECRRRRRTGLGPRRTSPLRPFSTSADRQLTLRGGIARTHVVVDATASVS